MSDELRIVLVILAATNILGFIIVPWDKSKREGDPEDYVPHPVLLIAALGGGSMGIILALKLFGYSFKSNVQTLIVVSSVLLYIYIISLNRDWIIFNL